MPDNLLYVIIFLLAFAVFVTVAVILFKRRDSGYDLDDMEGHDFEYYCASLLEDNGFEDVEVTKSSGDFGVDILASRDGVSYAFQCKCHDKPIGVKAVQEVYAGRDFYDRMVGVVITNQYFTQPAQILAGKLRVMMWDRDVIEELERTAQLQEE